MNRMDWKPEFASRFRRHEDELKWLYCELYHNDRAAYEYFVEMLYRAWEARPEKLKLTDRARDEFPDWYKGHDLVGMQLYVKAFAGTLKGVRKKLDYIADCGVNLLHLMPLLESPREHGDGGWAVSDFRKVQPELGTMEDLAALAGKCHERGISLCLDFVMSHTSDEHEWARRARAGDKVCQSRYFCYDNWEIPNAYEQTVPQALPIAAPGNFSWCEEAKKVVMTTFHSYEWDLNYGNPSVFNDMTDQLLNLCNHGADVIRLGGAPCLWKALGTSCRDLPQTHSLLRMLRMACEIVCPATLLLGAVSADPGAASPYFGSADRPECHLLCDMSAMPAIWNTVATRDARLLAHQLSQLFALPKGCVFVHYLRNYDAVSWGLDYGFLRCFGQEETPHRKFLNDYLIGKWYGSHARGVLYPDDPKLGEAALCGTTASLCGIEAAREKGDAGDMGRAIQLDAMLHALLFTLSGVPVLCSGDEIAQENDKDYRDDPLKREDSRNLHRGDLDWEKAALRKKKTTPEGRVFSAIRKMESLRGQLAVFGSGADVWLVDTGCDGVLGIGRYDQGEKLIALFNFSQEDQTAWVRDASRFTDLMSGEVRDAGAVPVPAGGFRWLYQ